MDSFGHRFNGEGTSNISSKGSSGPEMFIRAEERVVGIDVSLGVEYRTHGSLQILMCVGRWRRPAAGPSIARGLILWSIGGGC